MKALLLNPWAWLALVAGLTFSTGIGGVWGYHRAAQEAAARETTAKLAASEQLAVETGKVTALEKKRVKDIGAVAVIHKKEMSNADTKINSLVADVRRSAVLLSIATRPASHRAAGGNPAAAGSPAKETRSELVPEAAIALIGIAADGDNAMRDFNACHDSYEAIRLRTIQQ